VVGGSGQGPFSNVNVWTEVLQDTMLDFFDSGKLNFASATSLSLSEPGFQRLYADWEKYTSRLVLRPIQYSNHPEPIRRLGVIGMNTPAEFDIYGHANSTLINGSRMINGIGGSGDFLRNAYLSIMHWPLDAPLQTDPTGITCVVPTGHHVDHTEHDLDILVTEQGLADRAGSAAGAGPGDHRPVSIPSTSRSYRTTSTGPNPNACPGDGAPAAPAVQRLSDAEKPDRKRYHEDRPLGVLTLERYRRG
jgi:acyl-CoA hydrolase